ncbi:hypothetical protein DSL92_06805 [Billgrantia gudaonensis]|uniref:DSBA-like thioredoxin domain-containing protein n=1 Tax=Billgrantia gudaonensis TaxID=376427 RepID=A0A3S0VSL5_9GAMM|nr:hypothetical protein DSL92_06805 [Halomonas gudaonensis]
MPHVDITVISDAICPWCFIASATWISPWPNCPRKSAYRLAGIPSNSTRHARRGCRGAITAPPSSALGALPGSRRPGGGRCRQAVSRFPRAHDAYAQHLRCSPADLARRGTWRPVGRGRRAFRYYFVEGQDIGDSVVLATLPDAGWRISTYPPFSRATGPERGKSRPRRAQRLGVSGVPTFIIDDAVGLAGAQPPSTARRSSKRIGKR